MEKRKIAVVVSNKNQDVSILETINAIYDAGFRNVFIQWYNRDWNPDQEKQLKYIKEKGLYVIFAHLGYQNINALWLEGETGEQLVDRYKNDIKICKENEIPMVVMHLTGGNKAPEYNETGLKRLQEIADYAETLHIKIAFENTKIKGYLDYAMENITNQNVGICFDSGHYHVHFDDDFDFAKFKNRIFAVHLHDNDKSDDLHLIPFDGTLDWKNVVKNLKENHYHGPITMEFCYQYGYTSIGIEEFYRKGYEAGEKLREMFDDV